MLVQYTEMSLFSLHHPTSAHTGQEPKAALTALLQRMHRRLYPETLPALASCWLKTLCAGNHGRAWWNHLRDGVDRVLRDPSVEPFSRAVLISARNWMEGVVLAGGHAGWQRPQPPFRSVAPDRLVPYVCRLLNEWLPAEVAVLLTEEPEAELPDDGIPVLARAKALDRLLVRERLSPETLERLLEFGTLSPNLVYAGDAEILQDVVLALLGRVSAPPLPTLPAELLGVAGDSALPPDYADCVHRAYLEKAESGAEELHVPISDAAGLEILGHDAVRFGSVVVTMDGRAWQPWKLLRDDGSRIVYRPGERLRIDCTADHAKLVVEWPETLSSLAGTLPPRGPFALFGREWRAESWEMDGQTTRLHLTFSRILEIPESAASAAARGRLQAASVDIAWSELQRALADSFARNSGEPIEQMRRAELIPLARSLFGLAECVHSYKVADVEQHLRAARYHQASVEPVYGRAPWRVLPDRVQATLATARFSPPLVELLSGIFADPPPLARAHVPARSAGPSTTPSRAA